MTGEQLLIILLYVCLAAAIVGGFAGLITRDIFSQVSTRKPAQSSLRCFGIGFFVTVLSGGIYFMVSLHNTAREISDQMHGYAMSTALSKDYLAVGQYLDSIDEKLMTDAVIAALMGTVLTIAVIVLACLSYTKPNIPNQN